MPPLAQAGPPPFPYGWVQQPKFARLTPNQIATLPKAKQQEVRELLTEWDNTLAANPLYGVYARSQNQHDFMASKAFISAVFAGNRFGKTAAQVILAIINCIPFQDVPDHLKQYRTYLDDEPFFARMCVPSLQDHAFGVTIPLLRRWLPTYTLEGGGWDRAWSTKFMTLRFKNGSFIEFRSYDQDLQAHQGSTRHAIYFDEQPPKAIYEESLSRVAEMQGAHMTFALTPLGLSWIYHEVYKKRNEPDIEVFSGSIHDNDTLSKENVELALSKFTNKAQREAREFGRFVSMQGRVYDSFSSASPYDDPPGHVTPNIRVEQLGDGGDIYIGIDPGIRNPAAVLCRANNLAEQLLVFDEVRPNFSSTMNVETFCRQIKERETFWHVANPIYIIDPAARIRDQASGEQLIAEFARHGIDAIPGNNKMEVGISRVNNLIEGNRLAVCERCTALIDEFEIWSWDQKPGTEDGMGRPRAQEGNDHGLDALRYVVMALGWSGGDLGTLAGPKPPTYPRGTLGADIQGPQKITINEYNWM